MPARTATNRRIPRALMSQYRRISLGFLIGHDRPAFVFRASRSVHRFAWGPPHFTGAAFPWTKACFQALKRA